ncbi:MAG: ATP synthase F1 subunit gamma, partial [Fimbriimonadaceae bacterium]|nr:ATP synthase F1 subunit gamma [Fimbriimonadaceae bacterium]
GSAGALPPHPLLQRREIKKIVLVLITADRGLAGSYNTNILRKASDWMKEQDVPVELVTVGKKGVQFFGKRGGTIIHSVSVPTSGANVEDAVALTNKVTELFEGEECDAVYLCYSKFYSPIRQEPQVVQVLPIEPPTQVESDLSKSAGKEYGFEPAPEELLGYLLPKYLLTVILQSLLESAASEHGARMTAMSNATDNAGKMIGELTLQANRSRQAGITKEILEIVAGAEALKS